MAGVIALDVMLMIMLVGFTLTALSHIIATWRLRKDFYVAMSRSPLLATTSGFVGVVIGAFAVARLILIPDQLVVLFISAIILVPLMEFGFLGPYVIRGVRLLVMYNPSTREHWGRFFNNELAVVKILLVAFGVVEVIAWSAALLFGMETTAYVILGGLLIDLLVTLGATFALLGKLRLADDLFDVSLEIRRVGASVLLALAMSVFQVWIPIKAQPYYYTLLTVTRFHAAVWITNIQPIRAILRRRQHHHHNGGILASFLPYIPWRENASTVAVDAVGRSPLSRGASSPSFNCSAKMDDALEQILVFPPLLEAFQELCQKALCIESLMFLKAAVGFRESLHASTANDDDNFVLLTEIVNKYVKGGSPFEVNIDSKTKANILEKTTRETFVQLPQDDVAKILDNAAREVGKVLKDNLYNRFRDTDQFKQITG
ncbi:unnamed protein product, partial [Ectocarpus fasciculatus]